MLYIVLINEFYKEKGIETIKSDHDFRQRSFAFD